MSDTPETDAQANPVFGKHSCATVLADFARKLERERDGARQLAEEFHRDQVNLLLERENAQKELSSIHRWIERNHPDNFIDSMTFHQNLERVTDNWYDRLVRLEIDANQFERERDEAKAELADHKSALEIANRSADDQMRQKRLAERERDEARSERNQLKSLNESYAACWDEIKNVLNESNQGDKTCDLDRVLKAIRERDEAREAAAKWESSSDAMERAGAEQARRADENREWALKAERERDEAHALLDTASDRIEQLNGLCNLLRDERDILRSNKMSDPLLETTFKHLNRERDEACQVQNGLAKQVEQLRKERDQLKEALEHAQMTIGSIVSPSDKATLELIKVTKERDEARAAAKQLINIASHCLGWHENANPETITEAIKRWNASTKK